MGNDKKVTGIPAAEAAAVQELVEYQAGAVVSRQIVKQEKGNVTLFAFDTGQELSEHTAPFDALVHVLEGEVEITISGKPIRTRAGEMVLMPANQPHALRAVSRFKMLLTMIRA
jgi:quercetin dioxygenase-like cupin family protein